METAELIEYICDGCQRTFYSSDLVLGYHGEVIRSPDGAKADWFACRATCIQGAVERALPE